MTDSAFSTASQAREVLATQVDNRYKILEDRARQGPSNPGDFTGAVQGKFVKWDSDGSVIIEYNNKEYKTKALGFTAIPKGSTVEMTYVTGIYYSKW